MKAAHRYLVWAAAALAAVFAVAAVVSHVRLVRLESEIERAKAAAAERTARADQPEKETYVFKEKIKTLEASVAGLTAETRRQDADLERLAADTDAARRALYGERRRANK